MCDDEIMQLPPRAAVLRVCHAMMSPVSSVWKDLSCVLAYRSIEGVCLRSLQYSSSSVSHEDWS